MRKEIRFFISNREYNCNAKRHNLCITYIKELATIIKTLT